MRGFRLDVDLWETFTWRQSSHMLDPGVQLSFLEGQEKKERVDQTMLLHDELNMQKV